MISNFWDGKHMDKDLTVHHNELIEEMGVFAPFMNFDCPFCNEKMDNRSIRKVGFCLNARNLGDVFVEFCCDKCNKMDTLYYRNVVDKLQDFFNLWTQFKILDKPIIEEDVFFLKYNNLLEKISSKKDVGGNMAILKTSTCACKFESFLTYSCKCGNVEVYDINDLSDKICKACGEKEELVSSHCESCIEKPTDKN